MNKTFFVGLLSVFIYSCAGNDAADGPPGDIVKSNVTQLSYSVAATLPHDTSSYTQGLEFYNGQLLEGTGNYGKSKLLQVDLKTGTAQKQIPLDSVYFGEGITVLHDTLYQLTWQEKKVFVYTVKDFRKVAELSINTDGWGLTNNGNELIATDGSNNLYFYEPGTFRLLRVQGVTADGVPTGALNELEFINGFVYANQYETPYIYKIDPATGEVVARMDLTDIVNRIKATAPYANVLNGIAYNPQTKKLYVTGKLWPEMYEISVPL